METLDRLRQTFWSEHIWTPPNATWALYEERGYRHFNDLYYATYTAVILVILRFGLDRFIYTPVGVWMGLAPNRARAPPPNPILEKTFKATRGKLTDKLLLGLTKQLDMNERKIQRWMRHRAAQNRPTVLSKFTESAWRANFYACMFAYGVYILWDKPWFWDSMECFKDYPHHQVTNEEWWYYNIECAFYLSLLVSQFFDVQRKDFWVMFVHHVVTLCLLTFSWASNLVRTGTLVLMIHDFADIPLDGAKMLAYVKKQRAADVTFNVFTLCWVLSRLIFLPYRIIYYSTYVALDLVPMFPAYWIFNGLLISLQLLHIIWTFFIIRVVIHAWHNNGIKDIRSEDEDEDEVITSSSSSSDLAAEGNQAADDDDEEESEEVAIKETKHQNGSAKLANGAIKKKTRKL